MTEGLAADIKDKAAEIGFISCGFTTPSAIPDAPAHLNSFLQNGYHGTMEWMEDRQVWRGDPSKLWPEAKSVIMLADSYAPDHDPLSVLSQNDKAAISVYAQNQDYHDIVKKRLKRLGRWLIEKAGGEIKVFVDTAPVMEKPLGAAAGIGWQGKHTNLVSREIGNWFFLGAVFTTLELPVDPAETDHCGSCRACLDICPTDAFPAPYQLDARRCISYLTIEHKGPIPLDLREKLGNRIYGCDDCLAACPWNKFAQLPTQMGLRARPELTAPKLEELARLDDASFRTHFRKSPIKRIGRDRFLRNVAYAIGNSGIDALKPTAHNLSTEADETLAEAGQWALAKLEGRL